MSLTSVGITGYRSIKSIAVPLRRLTVLVGGNGVGKTNLYRSLELLQAAARGTLAEEIAREGGLASILYAGELKKHEPRHLRLEATLGDILESGEELTYSVEARFPVPIQSAAFRTEAQIREERLSLLGRRRVDLMHRDGPAIWARDGEGNRQLIDEQLLASETALANVRGTQREIDSTRHVIAGWRFYHVFRTDADSPLRRPSLAVTSPTLDSSGANLAAVFATLRHVRNESIDLDAAIDLAFPGASLIVPPPEELATFSMRFPDMPKRQFGAHELSDGTLQFLALAGALLAYRLPPFVALNEPETSLHPSLLPALGKMIATAAERTQIWVVTHSRDLADAITDHSGVLPREVIRQDGATWLAGLTRYAGFDDDQEPIPAPSVSSHPTSRRLR